LYISAISSGKRTELLIFIATNKEEDAMNCLAKRIIGSMLFVTLMATVVFLCSGLSLSAQEQPSDNMKIFVEKIRADKKFIISENLQLTDSEAKAFWPLYEKYQNETFLLRTRLAKLIKDYAASYNTMTNEKAKKLLNESMTIESLQLKLRQAYLPRFSKVLPEVKVARYYQIENKIYIGLLYELAGRIPLVNTETK